MEGASGDASNPQGQNLTDIQSYLVNFNKEIEGAPLAQISASISDETVEAAESTTVQSDGNSPSNHFDNVYYEGQLMPGADQQEQEPGQDSSVIPIQGFVVDSGTDPNDVSAETENEVLSGVEETKLEPESLPQHQNTATETTLSILDAAQQLSVVHAQIAELSGATEIQPGVAFQSVENQDVQEMQEVVQQVQVTMPESDIVTNTTTDMIVSESTEQSVEMVTVSEDGTIQRVPMDSDSIVAISATQGDHDISVGENVHVQAEGEQMIHHYHHVLQDGHGIDGSDPVAVLASVAANTSSALSHLQGAAVSQSEVHNAQLVALQSASDSSQPQLVAVQTPDGMGTETVQVMGAAEASALASGQVVLNNCGTHFQTVTIMPSEVSQGGEVSYVLIVSQPESERDGVPRNLSDMSIYDFRDDPNREVIEEIIDENGTPRKIIRVRRADPSSPTTQLMCNYCNYTSPKRYLLTRHMKSHSEERPHKCGICSRGFKTVASLQNHVNTHTGTRPHKCKLCESSFTTSGELVRHVRYRHTFEKPHKCTECDYASVELSKLKRHIRSHTGERPYQCSFCAYASPDTYKLKRHMRIHTGEKPYECDICHAHFTQSNSLKAHRLIHSCNKPVFQCDLCPTTCGRKTDLKIHMQKLHTADTPLECKKCSQVFPDRYSYKVHLRSHEGEKCFKCEQCDYAALSQRHLDSHMLTHTGEKPYECNECGQTFRQKQLLRRHKNLYHTPDYLPSPPKDKSFDCSDCDKSYAHRGNLSRHRNLHDPDNPLYNKEMSRDITSTDILHRNIIAEIQDGRLTNPAGKAPQVVIVHLDGRVEEVNASGAVTVQQKTTDAMVEMAMQTMHHRITDAVAQSSTDDCATEENIAASTQPGTEAITHVSETAAFTPVSSTSAVTNKVGTAAVAPVSGISAVTQGSTSTAATQPSTGVAAQTTVQHVQEGMTVEPQVSIRAVTVRPGGADTVTSVTLGEAFHIDGATDEMSMTSGPVVTTENVVTEMTPAYAVPDGHQSLTDMTDVSEEMHDAGTQVAFESDSESDPDSEEEPTVIAVEPEGDGVSDASMPFIITRVETTTSEDLEASIDQTSRGGDGQHTTDVISVQTAEDTETDEGFHLVAQVNPQPVASRGDESSGASSGLMVMEEGSSAQEEHTDQVETLSVTESGVENTEHAKSARALFIEKDTNASAKEIVVTPRKRGRPPTKRKSAEGSGTETTISTTSTPLSMSVPGRATRSRTSSCESTPQKASGSSAQKTSESTEDMSGGSTPQKEGTERGMRSRKRRPDVEEFLESKRSRRSDTGGKSGIPGTASKK